MRVLFVSAEMPFPPHKGQRMRNWAILRALAAEGHEVTLIAFAEAEELMADQSTLRKLCPVVDLVPSPSNNHRGFLRYLARLRSLGSRLPHGPWRFRSPALVACVRRHMERQAFDVVIWDEVYNLENLQEPLPVPVLLNHHDVMQVVWRRYLEVEPNPIKRAYAWTEYCKLLRWEGQACSRVAGVLACSEVDREVLKQICPQVPVAVVPNVVDTSSYVPVSKDDGSTILFVGGMDWYPNQDAVAFFGKNIFPLIRELAPAARFVVAGRGPSPEFRAGFAGIPGIEFTGRVQDIRSVIASAAVCVVPVRIGSGVRWKILEAAAMEALRAWTLPTARKSCSPIVPRSSPRALSACCAMNRSARRLAEQRGCVWSSSIVSRFCVAPFGKPCRCTHEKLFRHEWRHRLAYRREA